MSHSKLDRLPIEEQATWFKQWVVVCTACGRKGRSVNFPGLLPAMDEVWQDRWERAYDLMPLDELGRCPECSAATGQISN